jgi:formamidopyrimidine-DNA glycosylase
MPERPDLAHQLPLLEAAFTGCRLAGLRATDPVVQRVLLPAPPSTVLPGRVLTAIRRHGHFLRFVWDGVPPVETAVHLMLSGRFSIVGVEARCPKDAAFAFDFEGGRTLLLRDATQMAKVIHLAPEQAATVPGLGPVGVDVLGPDFTVAALAALLRRGDQRKTFLLDKAAVDSFGNAYADEALWAARLHPKARCRSLGAAEVERLHAAMVSTLQEATAEVAARRPALDEKVRDFLHIRNRKGQPCPRCGAPVRVAGVNGHDAFDCAVCQPDGPVRGRVDWRRLGGAAQSST